MTSLDTQSLAWRRVGERFIFLDIAKDRYFVLPEARQADFLTRIGGCAACDWYQPPVLPRPPDWQAPARVSNAVGEGPFRLGEVAAALWTQRRVAQRLAGTTFQAVLVDLRSLADLRARRKACDAGMDAVVRAFEQARLLKSAADRCLPRSIAQVLRIAAHGYRAHLAIGVKDRPFGAHAWVQFGDEVLNDSLEEVRRYTPILVV